MLKGMDLNLLLVFEAIYTAKNISRAADALDLSQPAVSNAVSRLRKQLGDPLFVRSGNGVEATSRAEDLIGPIREIVATLTQNFQPSHGFDPLTSKRHFNLIVADPIEDIVMEQLLKHRALNSQLTFSLLAPQYIQIEEMLTSGNCDLSAFLMSRNGFDLQTQPLCPLDLVYIVRKGHPRISETSPEQDFFQEGHVTMMLNLGKLANSEKLMAVQVKRLEACQVHKASSIPRIVARSDLVGFLPKIFAYETAEKFDLHILHPSKPISHQWFQMNWTSRNTHDAGHIWLREQIDMAVSNAWKKIEAFEAQRKHAGGNAVKLASV